MTQQTQPEYTVEAIDDRLFRMERLAYECILNHPESKGFCTEIQHISKELREAIRSRPAPAPEEKPCDHCDFNERDMQMAEAIMKAKKAERERVLCELLAYIHPDSRAGCVIIEKLKELRGDP